MVRVHRKESNRKVIGDVNKTIPLISWGRSYVLRLSLGPLPESARSNQDQAKEDTFRYKNHRN